MISRNIKKIKIISNKLYSILSTLSLNDFLKDENGGLVLPLNGKALNDEEWIKFKALKIDKNIKSIKKSKLPFDFCEKACVLVDEFRRKTYNLEEEWVIYFDYSTGEVIYCFEGTSGECKCKYERINFNNKNIASIHNHPMNYFSFPSPNNFDILKNDFEDYEIIIAFNSYWIIKYKGIINENEKKIINEEIKFIINEIGNKIIQNNNYDKDKINYKIEYNVSEFLLNYFNKKTKIKAYKMEYE